MFSEKNKFNTEQEGPDNDTPERALWFAVIERALKDYCFFFDRLASSGAGHLINIDKLRPAYRENFTLKAIAEVERLRWFLFCKTPEPFNLQYLAEQLYDDGPGMASTIRNEAAQQFRLHLIEAEQQNRFVAIVNYIKESTSATNVAPALVESKLRHKRSRPTS